jgi:hypothetical protein
VGQIDYLVERGLYTNRSDFIRMAIRKQAESHSKDINQFLTPEMPETEQRRYFGGLGLFRLTRTYVETLITFGAKVHISVVGTLTIDKTITREQLSQVMAGCKVYGKIFAEDEIKQALKSKD